MTLITKEAPRGSHHPALFTDPNQLPLGSPLPCQTKVTSAVLPLPALPGDVQTEVVVISSLSTCLISINFLKRMILVVLTRSVFQVLQAILTLSCHPCWVVSGQVALIRTHPFLLLDCLIV